MVYNSMMGPLLFYPGPGSSRPIEKCFLKFLFKKKRNGKSKYFSDLILNNVKQNSF